MEQYIYIEPGIIYLWILSSLVAKLDTDDLDRASNVIFPHSYITVNHFIPNSTNEFLIKNTTASTMTMT